MKLFCREHPPLPPQGLLRFLFAFCAYKLYRINRIMKLRRRRGVAESLPAASGAGRDADRRVYSVCVLLWLSELLRVAHRMQVKNTATITGTTTNGEVMFIVVLPEN